MSEQTQSEGCSSARFEREALAADARALVATVEDVHPEPYVGYDGRVALHARLERVVRELPEVATVEEFYRRAAPLVAGLADSHSMLHPPDRESETGGEGESRRLPVSFRVVGERLYVESVFDDRLTGLVGGRLVAVEGVAVETLVERGETLRGAENRYGAVANAGRLVERYESLDRLLDRSGPPREPTLRVAVDGETQSVAVTPAVVDAEPTRELAESVPRPAGTGPRYRLYEGGDAAVFVPGDLQGYRESYEAAMDRGAEFPAELAPDAYDRHVGGDRPDDLAATVAALPSMMEALTALFDGMAAAETETLVVDLRDNPGGDSTFVFHVAYALRGWDGVECVCDATRSVKRRTDAHRDRYGVGAEGAGTADGNPAGYDFSSFLDDSDDAASRMRESLVRSDTFAAVADAKSREAAYEPERVVVAVSAGTMSSGFAGAAQLSSLGADVVGVPPGQAPVSFGEPVEETLPNTGLTVSVSGAMYHWLPDSDADALRPDRELTPALFERYDCASDAGLRLAFDYAGVTDGDPPEPVE